MPWRSCERGVEVVCSGSGVVPPGFEANRSTILPSRRSAPQELRYQVGWLVQGGGARGPSRRPTRGLARGLDQAVAGCPVGGGTRAIQLRFVLTRGARLFAFRLARVLR